MGDGSLPFLIIALAASATAFEALRAIFLYVPDSSTVLTLLPGHRMLMQGRGMQAVRICSLSLVLSSALALLLLPASFLLFPVLYEALRPIMPYVLLLLSLILVASERKPGKVAGALLCFGLSGALGLLVFGYPVVREPLFPSFAGLFAISGLALSMSKQVPIPPQTDRRGAPLSLVPVIALGTVLAALADLLPGISSPAQIAVFASIFIYLNSARFLALVSSISASHLVFALSALVTTGKARVGSIALAAAAAGQISADWAFAMAGAALLATGISAYLLLPFARRILPLLSSAQPRALNSLVLAYILSLIYIMGSPPALLVAAVASFIGAVPPLIGVRRTHVMGFILLPSIARLLF